MRAKEKNKISVSLLLFRIISIIIILVCLFSLSNWYIENKKNSKIIDNLRSQITFPDINSTSKVDFSNLISINPDTVAWIKVNNTNIDFSIVQSNNNEYYLKHNFNKEYNSSGWIFADYRNKFDNTDKNIIIYGHNTQNGNMFSTLKNTTKKSWYTNPDNLLISFYTIMGSYNYQIFSIYTIRAQNFNDSIEFSTDTEFQNYIDDISSKSIYDFGIEVTPNDNLLTLYTCNTNNTDRIVVHAKRLQ